MADERIQSALIRCYGDILCFSNVRIQSCPTINTIIIVSNSLFFLKKKDDLLYLARNKT